MSVWRLFVGAALYDGRIPHLVAREPARSQNGENRQLHRQMDERMKALLGIFTAADGGQRWI